MHLIFFLGQEKIVKTMVPTKKALKKLRGKPEVTRFKGLGEISPSEFGQFIGEDIRLVRVNVKTLKSIQDTMQFYMGKNTPDRREYIMENLI